MKSTILRQSLSWVSAWFLMCPLIAQAAAPQLLSPPTTESISSSGNPDKSADFVFDQPMSRTGIDVGWQGTGIDPTKISYVWSPAAIPGFELPAFILECTYAGGWPPGVQVTWTLNPGNSGTIKSQAGEAKATESGTFTTPGTAGGGDVQITPSATEVAVGEELLLEFSVPMDRTVAANSIFQATAGQWQCRWDSTTALQCTLTGGVPAGSTVSATYVLVGLKTAAGTAVANFTGNVTLTAESDPGGGTAPILAAMPTTESLLANLGKAHHVFNMPMNSTAVDIRWSGPGIDATKISTSWLAFNIPGVPIPVTTLESTYQGGWPRSVEVSWILNPGNSGVIKSSQGVALAEVSGSFVTPAAGPGIDPGGNGDDECGEPSTNNVGSAAITLFKEINFVQTSSADPVFDTERKAMVNSSVFTSPSNTPPAVVTGATLNKPDGTSVALEKLTVEIPDIPGFPIPEFNIPDTFFLSTTPAPELTFPTFNSLAELNAAYPNGNYTMNVTLQGGGSRAVALPLNPAPEPPTPKIENFAALQNFDVAQPLVVRWGAFAGAGERDVIQLQIQERGGTTVYSAPNRCANIELLVTDTSHTIPAGTFRAGAAYDLELTFSKTAHLRQAATGGAVGQNQIAGYSEFVLLTKTTRTAIGAPTAPSDLRFTRVFKEQAIGKTVVSLEISGSLPSPGAVAIVQGSQDLVTWTDTGIVIPKATLDAQGGVFIAQDPLFLGTPHPHRFYRIAVP